MLSFLTKITNSRNLTIVLGIFVVSAIAEGVTLAMLIPLLRSLLSDGAAFGTWATAVCLGGLLTFSLHLWAYLRALRVSVYDVCDDLMKRIADRTMELPLGWFTAKREALIASAMSREINTISHIASMLLPALTSQFVVPGVLMIALVFIDWRLSLVMLITVALLRWGWRFMRRSNEDATKAETEAATMAAGRIIEFSRLQPILRANGVTRDGWALTDDALARENRAVQASMAAKERPVKAYTLIVNSAFAAVMLLGFWLVTGGAIDMPAFLALAVVAVRITHPLSLSVVYGEEVHKSELAMNRIDSILHAPLLPEPGTDAVEDLGDHSIGFNGVTFGYDASRPVLTTIDFVAEAKEITALVGASGSGKSTLLRLAARFWDADEGTVTIGGTDVRRIPTAVLMRHTSMVFQDAYLFDMTIRENVRLAKPDATDDDLEEAARQARLDSVIASLPDGWETRVGQGGLKLSGGERQRVSIARAFVKDAPILLLDEITSALDGENEAAITQVMQDLARGRTVIVVAHRMSTIRGADKVVVLRPGENGAPAQVAQIGTPEDLLARDGIFADFVAASTAASRWRIARVKDS